MCVYIYIEIFMVEIHFSQVLCNIRKILHHLNSENLLSQFCLRTVRQNLKIDRVTIKTAMQNLHTEGVIKWTSTRKT